MRERTLWAQHFIAPQPVGLLNHLLYSARQWSFSLRTFESCFIIFTIWLRREQMDSKVLIRLCLFLFLIDFTVWHSYPVQYRSYAMQLVILVICLKSYSFMSIHNTVWFQGQFRFILRSHSAIFYLHIQIIDLTITLFSSLQYEWHWASL